MIGDERRRLAWQAEKPLSSETGREGAVSRMIRESEDLPEYGEELSRSEVASRVLRIKKGNPRSRESVWDFILGIRKVHVF